jgi:negative regulator of flagellin synthesis FlgM
MSINKLGAHDAARTYLQSSEASRSANAAARKESQPAAPAARSQGVEVSLSDDARSLAAARDAVANASDVREEKVAEIKKRVEDGTYNVPSSVLARKLIDAGA